MTMNDFVAICEEHLIDPELALENDAVRAALATRDDNQVTRVLSEEF